MIWQPIYVWKHAPFIRLLIPLTAGIVCQWYLQIHTATLLIPLIVSILILVTFFFISSFQKFKLAALNGIAITFLFISLGALLTWNKDVRHSKKWFANQYRP